MQNSLASGITRAKVITTQTKRQMDRVAAQARREKGQRIARERKALEAQSALEEHLNRQVTTAMRGISAIIRLCKEDEQMQELLKARDAIGKSVSLYEAYRDGGSAWDFLIAGQREGYVWGVHNPRDQEISVGVSLHPDKVVLAVHILFYSYLDHSGRVRGEEKTSVWECDVPLSLTRKQRKEMASQLRAIVLHNTNSPWDAVETDPEYQEQATSELLKEIRHTKVSLAANGVGGTVQSEYEWKANLILFRFLMDCSRPEQLWLHLSNAIMGIK